MKIPEGVKVKILSDKIEFEGPKGKLSSSLLPGIKVEVNGDLRIKAVLEGIARQEMTVRVLIRVESGTDFDCEIEGLDNASVFIPLHERTCAEGALLNPGEYDIIVEGVLAQD